MSTLVQRKTVGKAEIKADSAPLVENPTKTEDKSA